MSFGPSLSWKFWTNYKRLFYAGTLMFREFSLEVLILVWIVQVLNLVALIYSVKRKSSV